MSLIDETYKDISTHILYHGYEYKDESRDIVLRQTDSVFIKHKMSLGFPLLTTKKMFYKGIVGELLWFISGSSNIRYLVENGINIWNKDAYNFYLKITHNPNLTFEQYVEKVKQGEYGFVGKNYGANWRRFGSTNFDQLASVYESLKNNPMNRRHIVQAWDSSSINETALPPCHWAFEFIVQPKGDTYILSLKWHQRSCDWFLGVPYNIASYALLLEIFAQILGYEVGYLYGDLSNVHIYENHIDSVKTQIERSPKVYDLCKLQLPDIKGYVEKVGIRVAFDTLFKQFSIDDFKFLNYQSYPAIKAEMIAPKPIFRQ